MECVHFSEFSEMEKIGKGGFGTVYKARINSLFGNSHGGTVALKCCETLPCFLTEVCKIELLLITLCLVTYFIYHPTVKSVQENEQISGFVEMLWYNHG